MEEKRFAENKEKNKKNLVVGTGLGRRDGAEGGGVGPCGGAEVVRIVREAPAPAAIRGRLLLQGAAGDEGLAAAAEPWRLILKEVGHDDVGPPVPPRRGNDDVQMGYVDGVVAGHGEVHDAVREGGREHVVEGAGTPSGVPEGHL